MPFYDFRCPQGHVTERRAGFGQSAIGCPCGVAAERVAVNRIGFSGFAVAPMAERNIPLRRFEEAHGEMLRTAERTGVQAPDVMAIARWQAEQIKRHSPELITGT
jgi:hypothetical protein